MGKPAHILLVLFSLGLFMVGCKTPKETADSYKYLLKDKSGNPIAATPVSTPKTDTDPADNNEGGLRGEETTSEDGEVPASKDITKVIQEAKTYLGVPYRYGGINRNGIDCSALTSNAYQSIGMKLPRSSKDQSSFGLPVKRKRLRPGDLVFFTAKNNGKIDHVGMVTKVKSEEVTFIHATTRKGVRFDRLDVGYWTNLFVSARRPGTH